LRKGEATRARIVQEAGRQTAIRGLAGVSLNDVAEAVGLSKSGLFKHFESKEAMEEAMLLALFDRFRAHVWAPSEPLPAGRPRLEAIFDRWLDWFEVEHPESGCPVHAYAVELDDQPGPLRDLMHLYLKRWYRVLAREFAAMRDPPLSDDEARLAAFQFRSFMFGHGEESRLLGNEDALRLTRASFEALLDRIEQA